MRKLLAVLLPVVVLAGCSHSTTVTKTVGPSASAPAVTQPATTGCIVGRSFMGCSLSAPSLGPKLTLGSAPVGARFVDVSDWQGSHLDWAAAKPHIVGAVIKLGEGKAVDPTAAVNAAALRKLGIPFLGYWFVRNDGCSAEGHALETETRLLGVRKVELDEEVAGVQGYAKCLIPYARAVTGVDPGVYRSAENNEDTTADGLVCWVADYGPSTAPACNGRPAAFQYTDGRFGFPTFIPGIGLGDVNVNLGLFSTPPVDPFPKAPNTLRSFDHGRVHAREHNTLVTASKHLCHLGRKRPGLAVCRSSKSHALLLIHRLDAVATDHGHLRPSKQKWSIANRGIRHAYLARALTHK